MCLQSLIKYTCLNLLSIIYKLFADCWSSSYTASWVTSSIFTRTDDRSIYKRGGCNAVRLELSSNEWHAKAFKVQYIEHSEMRMS
jgi:hypothetical protein